MMLFKRWFKGSGSVVKNRLKNVLAADRSAVAPDVVERLQALIKELLSAELKQPAEEIVTGAQSRRDGEKTVLELTAAYSVRQSA